MLHGSGGLAYCRGEYHRDRYDTVTKHNRAKFAVVSAIASLLNRPVAEHEVLLVCVLHLLFAQSHGTGEVPLRALLSCVSSGHLHFQP